MYNRQLGMRGRVLTLFLKKGDSDFRKELKKMNRKKEGRQYKYPNSIVHLGFCVKCLFHLGYRQLEFYMKEMSRLLSFTIPNFRIFWYRINVLEHQELHFNLPTSENIAIAVDSTGLKLANDGEYRSTKYGKRKCWIKMHTTINIDMNEVVEVVITKDNICDSKKFRSLIEPLKDVVESVRADKGYDTSENFEYCKRNKISAIIPVRINAVPSGKGSRQEATRDQFDIPKTHMQLGYFDKLERRLGKQADWKRRTKYGFRWAVEGFYSRYKRIFGEFVFSTNWKNIEKEIITKINILNLFAVLR